jgi:hypothetical protein
MAGHYFLPNKINSNYTFCFIFYKAEIFEIFYIFSKGHLISELPFGVVNFPKDCKFDEFLPINLKSA